MKPDPFAQLNLMMAIQAARADGFHYLANALESILRAQLAR